VGGEAADGQQELAGMATGGLPASGPADAPVTVVVFSDFECPYCARFAAIMRKEVLPAEGPRVRLVFRQFPLPMHSWARAAAEATDCAYRQKNDYFWSYHDYFFEHQRELTAGNLRERVMEHARAIPGLDRAKFEACLSKPETKTAVEREVTFGKDNGIHATPTVFLNGRRARVGDAAQMLSLVRQLVKDPQATVPPPEPAPTSNSHPQPREVAEAAKGDLPALGPSNAPVTPTVFSDFQCPYCAKFAKMMRKEVLPVAGGSVRLVFRYFPLSMHPWARESAQAAACAYQQKNDYFWSFHDFFFDHQRDLTPANLRPRILDHARGIAGLDQSKFRNCLEHGETKALVDHDVAFGNTNGIEAAPTVFLNGRETGIVASEQVLTLIRELSPGPAPARARGTALGEQR
jgi:protein-disulfide isomerase